MRPASSRSAEEWNWPPSCVVLPFGFLEFGEIFFLWLLAAGTGMVRYQPGVQGDFGLPPLTSLADATVLFLLSFSTSACTAALIFAFWVAVRECVRVEKFYR